MANDKLKLWNEVSETDPFYTKLVGFGAFKFTSINAQYQLRQATEQFGEYGRGWGIRTIEHEYITLPDGQIMAVGKALFFAGESEFEISSAIMVWNGKKPDDEFAKKLETDITTKALSKLGFSADVFLGRYDDNRYVNDMKKKFAEVPKKMISEKIYNEVIAKIVNADKASVKKISDWYNEFNENEFKIKIGKLLDARKKQL